MEEKVSTKPKKLTYEELKEMNKNLFQSATKLREEHAQLMEAYKQLTVRLKQVDNVMTILPLLFRVVEGKESYSADFVKLCKENLEGIMTNMLLPEEETPSGDNTPTDA